MPSCSVTIKTHIQINYGHLKFDQIWRIWRVRDRERQREREREKHQILGDMAKESEHV